MATFKTAFDKMIKNEGGYKLHSVDGDRGGQTYAGIARNYNPNWLGWSLIDNQRMDRPELTVLVSNFYQENYWNKVRGCEIESQHVAESLFDFAVNAGTKTASKLAQIAVGAAPDGVIGPQTLESINAVDEELFILKYALAKVARYAEICNRDRGQSKFLLGWTNRTIAGLS